MFAGNLVALITPMHPDGSIDESAFLSLIDWQLAENCEGFIINGTTGESATTTFDEKEQLLKLAKKQIRGRVPLIAGTGSNSTASSIALTQAAKAIGVDACLLVTPYYNKPTQAGLIAHYGAIANAVDIPIVLYNVPGRTACDMQAKTVATLRRQHANIVGIKEATGSMERLTELKSLIHRKNFSFLSGDDATALDFMKAGGDGVISVTTNVAPRQMTEWCTKARAKQWAAASTLFETLQGLHECLFIESNPIPTKWALQQRGLIQPGIRLPLTWLDPQHEEIVQRALLQARQ